MYDVITVITLGDQSALDEFRRIALTPGIAEQFAADEDKFLERSTMLIHVTDSQAAP
jgi:hypothetical protein